MKNTQQVYEETAFRIKASVALAAIGSVAGASAGWFASQFERIPLPDQFYDYWFSKSLAGIPLLQDLKLHGMTANQILLSFQDLKGDRADYWISKFDQTIHFINTGLLIGSAALVLVFLIYANKKEH